MLNIAVDDLLAAGWVQLGPDHWVDGQTGRDATYAQAVIAQGERGRAGLPSLSRGQWRALRIEELQLSLDEYGRLCIEHVASVTGINLLHLAPDISDHDLIVAIVDYEEEQRGQQAGIIYLETRGEGVWDFEAALVSRDIGTITGSGGGMRSRDLHLEVDDAAPATIAIRQLAAELGVTIERLDIVEDDQVRGKELS